MTYIATTLDIEIKADLEGIANRSGYVAEPEVTGLYVIRSWIDHTGGKKVVREEQVDILEGIPKGYRQEICNNILNAFYDESQEALEAEWKETAA
jgi:hypothetical protein